MLTTAGEKKWAVKIDVMAEFTKSYSPLDSLGENSLIS
jgi:hypothetical protein